MGGAVSSGRDNNELIDNLMGGNYIRSRNVERVFRALDRAEYMTPESRDQAYKDLAWRNGHLHMSSPCIYSEVMEGLELRPGLSFLNIGSGTGYLSTLAGLILGSGGISHGIEVHSSVVDYANKKLGQFLANSPTLDEFDFCEPKFIVGNGLCLPPQQPPYDRVYCGAGCPDEYENYFKQLIKVGGVLVMPLSDSLLQVRRVDTDQWVKQNLLTVSFAKLRVPLKEDALNYVRLEEQAPPRLQTLARGVVRGVMRRGVLRRAPELREPAPRRAPPAAAAAAACPRRICIPIEPGGAVEGLNILHDLDNETGADEMNALLSLVIRMDQNRVAGAIRFDRIDSSQSESSSNSDQSSDEGGPSDQAPEGRVLRSRRSRRMRENSDTGRSDEGRSTLSNSKSDERDSGSSSSTRSKNVRKSKRDRSDSDRRSKAKNERKSDRDRSEHDRRSKNGRKSNTHRSELDKSTKRDNNTHRTSSDDSSSSDKSRRRSHRDSSDNSKTRKDKGRRGQSGTPRRSGSSGSLLAFEFQATERNPQPTTSSGSVKSPDTSASTSENDGGNKDKKKSKKSSRRPPCEACNPVNDIIPAEVELCFRGGKVGPTRYLATRSETVVLGGDWGDNKTDTEEVMESSNDEKEVEKSEPTSKSKAKRQKLDSGIGENTPSSSSPDKSKADESDTDERPSDSVTDEADPAREPASRRRVHKRSRGAASEGASTSSSSAEEAAGPAGAAGAAGAGGGAGGAAGAGGARRRAARRGRRHDDVRRVRLSMRMKRAVNELPLPYPLKKYVNLDRCFEF